MEATTNINVSGVPVSIVEKLKRPGVNFSFEVRRALEAGVKALEAQEAAKNSPAKKEGDNPTIKSPTKPS